MDDRRRERKNRLADNDTVRFRNDKIAWPFVATIAVPMLGRLAGLTVVLLISTLIDLPVAITSRLRESRESRVESRESRGEKTGVRMVAAAPADRVKQYGRKR